MLTPAAEQVKLSMVRQTLRDYLHQRRPRRALVVSPDPDCASLLPGEGGHVVIISRPGNGIAPSVECAGDSLPFQSRVFDLVLAEHVLSHGAEPGLAEFERVLEGGGQLVVLGLGFWGSRYRLSRRDGAPTAIRPMRLCRELEYRDFTIEECAGAGIAGAQVRTGGGWKKPLLGVCDEVMIRARSQGSSRIVTPLRMGRTQAVGAQSAALDGLNREAVS